MSFFTKANRHQPCQPFDDRRRLPLREDLPLPDVVQQRPALHPLKNEVKGRRLLKVLNQLEDVVVAPAQVEGLHLLEDGRAGERGGGGVDLLHGDLHVNMDVV